MDQYDCSLDDKIIIYVIMYCGLSVFEVHFSLRIYVYYNAFFKTLRSVFNYFSHNNSIPV